MNTSLKTTLASFALLAGSMSTANAATTGVLEFTGTINDGACSISPLTEDQTIPLGSLSASSLSAGGVSAARPVKIELEGCVLGLGGDPAVNTVSVTFNGTPSTAVPGTFAIVGVGAGAGVQVLDTSGTPIAVNTTSSVKTFLAGDNTLNFSAQLKGPATGAVTPGAFTSVANFTLNYQ